jgi:HTH-like domain
MRIGRSTFLRHARCPRARPDHRCGDETICDEFEAYGYRRVNAELRHRGIVVNAKKMRRLMRAQALNPKQRRRFVATTDSDHNYPIFPNLAKNMKLDGPNQLWVADITYVTIATGFVYLAAILDQPLCQTGKCSTLELPMAAHKIPTSDPGRFLMETAPADSIGSPERSL